MLTAATLTSMLPPSSLALQSSTELAEPKHWAFKMLYESQTRHSTNADSTPAHQHVLPVGHV